MKIFLASIFAIFLITEYSSAQIPETMNASEILLHFKKLNVLGSVLYIAAHPDDENTLLLTWLSKDKLYRTGYLSLTRGDGGQNLIGDEQGVELGLIRTQELLAARKQDGAEQFFSRAYDFGFSKSTEESLRLWDKQKILSDVVWIIRKFQPDIIITRFPEDKRAGHGQHSASSVLARLAYSAAADPNQFPEQFKYGVHPWKADRLFWNNYRFGSINTTNESQLKIEVGGYNPLLGKSYGEIAADSRSQHRSQGFGIPHSRGNSTEYFTLTQGEKADSSLLENINCSWDRVPNGAAISKMINKLVSDYDPSAPFQSIKALVNIYKIINSLPAGYWRDQKLKEIITLIQACSGLYLEATVPEAYALLNQTIPVTLRVVNRTPVAISLNSVKLNNQDTNCNIPLQTGINYSFTRRISLRNLPVSQPYWLVEPMSPGSYNIDDQTLIGNPQNNPSLEAYFTVTVSGEEFLFKQRVSYKFTDPVKGEIYQPMTIVPTLMAYCDPALLVFEKGKEQELGVTEQQKVIKYTSEEKPTIVSTAAASATKPTHAVFSVSLTSLRGFETNKLDMMGATQNFNMKSEIPDDLKQDTWVTHAIQGSVDTVLQCRTISYDHIPRIDYFKPAKTTVVAVNLKILGKKIGYIDGAGDKVSEALSAMGYTVIRLDENSLTSATLQNLDAVIAGVRAYDVHNWLAGKYNVLMEYVKNGGNLIVQYNRNQGSDSTSLGPFPFGISSARVTEEDAQVTFLQPDHRVLHFPNEITAGDFTGWIQERGIYFAQHFDSRYQAVFSMHDTGEPDQNGSLIIGSYGKGSFTYTGLVFFRELPAGIPGAYRLFANIIALNQTKDK
jgi:LmbE family N-acetylglucosaminyl deacetylase